MHKGMKTQMICSWSLPNFYWGIWKERNNRIFKERETLIADKIDSTMREKFAIKKGRDIEEGGNNMEKKKKREMKR